MNGFADLLRSRATCLALSTAGMLHVALTASGVPAWPCPLRLATGIPCPGCGLGTAMAQLAHGDWHRSIATHAYAPVAAVAIFLVFASAVLPSPAVQKIAASCDRLDRHHITIATLVGLLIYWAWRMILDTHGLRSLPA